LLLKNLLVIQRKHSKINFVLVERLLLLHETQTTAFKLEVLFEVEKPKALMRSRRLIASVPRSPISNL